jgi:hypothetical protein
VNLIGYFRDVRGAKAVGLPAERHIESARAVETHDTIEARAAQEQKVEGVCGCIEPFPYSVKVCFTITLKLSTLNF